MKTSKMLVATFLITIFLTGAIFAFEINREDTIGKLKYCYGKASNGEYIGVSCGQAKGYVKIGGKCTNVGHCRDRLYTPVELIN